MKKSVVSKGKNFNKEYKEKKKRNILFQKTQKRKKNKIFFCSDGNKLRSGRNQFRVNRLFPLER